MIRSGARPARALGRLAAAGLVVASIGLVWAQQRRLDRLEAELREARAARAAPARAAAWIDAMAAGLPTTSPAPAQPQRPGARPAVAPAIAGTAAAALTDPGASGTRAGVAAAGFADRPSVADRLASVPAQPAMSDVEVVREFVAGHGIDQGQWNALVRLNGEWIDTLTRAQQHGITSLRGPIDRLARTHEDALRAVLGDPATLLAYRALVDELPAAHVVVQFGGITYKGARIE